jgi:type I restriction-modification system DNA methylase subunit
LNISLAKEPDLEYNLTKGRRFLVSNFLFDAEYSSFRLLKNKAVEFENVSKPFLLPELKYCDYLLRLEGEFSEEYLQHIMLKIKELNIIQHVEVLNVSNINSKENLLF